MFACAVYSPKNVWVHPLSSVFLITGNSRLVLALWKPPFLLGAITRALYRCYLLSFSRLTIRTASESLYLLLACFSSLPFSVSLKVTLYYCKRWGWLFQMVRFWLWFPLLRSDILLSKWKRYCKKRGKKDGKIKQKKKKTKNKKNK